MSSDGQLVIALTVVALAVAYVARSAWRTAFGKKIGCGSGCGKCATLPARPPRKGRIELPQI